MANSYRVDRANSRRVPCGMNSILYIGDNWEKARKVYAAAEIGRDSWNNENITYGVILSVWDSSKNDYIVKCEKGLN